MALRKIVEQGDPCLSKVCRPVTEFNGRLHELLDDMLELMPTVPALPPLRWVFCAGPASSSTWIPRNISSW